MENRKNLYLLLKELLMKFYNCLIKSFQSRHKIIDKSHIILNSYDAVDIIENLLDRGLEPAVRIKEKTIRMRYRVEQLFDNIKQKIGSSFKLLREDLARKVSMLVLFFGTSWCLQLTYFCYFCLISCTIATLKGYYIDF
jgi:hypothetical protein